MEADRPHLGILCARGPGGRGSLVASGAGRPPVRSVEVVPEELGAGRVAQLRHGLGFDLPDALPGDPVDLPDLVEGFGLPVGEAEPHGHHPGLALREGAEDRVELLLQQGEAGRLAGLDGLGVLDQVAELAVPSSPSGVCSEIGSRA